MLWVNTHRISCASSTHFQCSTGCSFSCSTVSSCCRPAFSAGPPAERRDKCQSTAESTRGRRSPRARRHQNSSKACTTHSSKASLFPLTSTRGSQVGPASLELHFPTCTDSACDKAMNTLSELLQEPPVFPGVRCTRSHRHQVPPAGPHQQDLLRPLRAPVMLLLAVSLSDTAHGCFPEVSHP